MPYKDASQKREYQRLWRAARRDEFFADKSCAKCESTERLELDHIDPALKVSHKIWSWSKERREAEIAKCQILCHDCHVEKSIEQGHKTDHGRGAMYQAPYRCRCDLCKAWKADSDKKYRSKENDPAW